MHGGRQTYTCRTPTLQRGTCCSWASLDFTHAFDSIPPPAFAYKSQNIWGVSSDDGGVDRAVSLYSPIWVYVSARCGKTLAATKPIIYKGGAVASDYAAHCSAPLCSRLPLMVQDFHWGCTEAEEIFLLICACHLHGCLIRGLGSIESGSKLMASAVRTHLLSCQEDHLIKAKTNTQVSFFLITVKKAIIKCLVNLLENSLIDCV